MFLTKEEERILDGEEGWARQVAMRIVVKLGDAFRADRLLPIEWAHLSGISYKTAGDSGMEFISELVSSGARVSVRATTNPCGLDEKLVRRLPERLVKMQKELLRLYAKIGARKTLSCAPYYEEEPKPGCHLAWAESSAVVYANSLLNAWTNREGAPSALASAVVGRTPNYGVHLEENRRPRICFELEFRPSGYLEHGLVGYYVGKAVEGEVPLIRGLESSSEDELKHLGASMATSGMVSLFRLDDGGPELEVVKVGREEVSSLLEELSHAPEEPDLVFIGCPHCSLGEASEVLNLLGNRKVKRNVELWVCLSRYVASRSETLVRELEARGAKVLTSTCAVVTWLREMGIEYVLTNSVKASYYIPRLSKAKVGLSDLRGCVFSCLG